MGLTWFPSQRTPLLLYTPLRMDGTVSILYWFLQVCILLVLIFTSFENAESLRLLSLHDNKYLRYFRGHHDRHAHTSNSIKCMQFQCQISRSTICFIDSCRVVSLSLCARTEHFISGSLDRTVLLWDQRADKCQVVFHST